jgi:hypothetical protein
MITLIIMSFASITASTLILQFGNYLRYKNETSVQQSVEKHDSLVYA